VNESGVIIDTNGFPICTELNEQIDPCIAYNGTDYLVTWSDYRNYQSDIYCARVSTSGVVLDPGGIPVCTTWYERESPKVASNGSDFFIVSQQWDMMYGVWGARISSTGSVIDTAGIFITTGHDAVVTFNGLQYIVSYMNGGNVHAKFISQDGSLIDSLVVCDDPHYERVVHAAAGPGNSILFIYTGWADMINTHPANTYRVWGRLYPFPSVSENIGKGAGSSVLKLIVSPNPFSDEMTIAASIPELKNANYAGLYGCQRTLSLKIYDVTGRLIKDLRVPPRSTLSVRWNGTDRVGAAMPAGVYFIRVEWGNVTAVEKIVKIER
jgi:hypothetical protein